jgi:hypothetical protein
MYQIHQVESLKELLESSNSILIILGSDCTLDQTCLATSLYLGLKQQDKNASLLGVDELKSRVKDLGDVVGLSELKNQLGKQNLVVSFDYDEDRVDKVSYHIGEKTNKFYLTVKPKKGHEPLSDKSVEFAYAGAEADIIFLVGVHDLTTLEQLYYGYESLYNDTTIVTINTFEPELGSIKLDFSGKSCMSEVCVDFLESLGIGIDGDMATNLLMSIEESTDGLTSLSATAETFEVMAKLLRVGGKRVRRSNVEGRKSEAESEQENKPSFVKTSDGGEVELTMGKSKKTKNSAKQGGAKKNKVKSGKTNSTLHSALQNQPGIRR